MYSILFLLREWYPMNQNKITNVGNPTELKDVTNKEYVDTKLSSKLDKDKNF